MLIHSASQLLTLAGGPQRGDDLGRLGIIPDGALLVQGGKIIAVGATHELKAAYPGEAALDAGGAAGGIRNWPGAPSWCVAKVSLPKWSRHTCKNLLTGK